MSKDIDIDGMVEVVKNCELQVRRGHVTAVRELSIEAQLPGARTGMRVTVDSPGNSPLHAEVAVCQGTVVTLVPLGTTAGVGPGDTVTSVESGDTISVGGALLGRIVDPLGNPVDGGEPLRGTIPWALERAAPNPLTRRPVDRLLETGLRVLDGCLPLGYGGRMGLFAGPGLGKTTLLGTLATRAACDVSVVALVGERGREVREFIDRVLTPEGLKKCVIVLAGADAPPALRMRALGAATSIAEWFRAEGKNALLLVDSLTRVVRAKRDLALSLGEKPGRGGYPASAFSSLPSMIERTGLDDRGSITALYAVLTEGEDDPVAEEARSLLDGHIMLSPKSAARGLWPAVDVVRSISRVMNTVAQDGHGAAALKLSQMLGSYEENEDLILIGAYKRGTAPLTDMVLERKKEIEAFISQSLEEPTPIDQTRDRLHLLVR